VSGLTFAPIGRVRSSRRDREDDDWGDVDSVIELDETRFSPASLLGLDEFSHIEVIFVFDRFDEAQVTTGARRPRGNPDWPEVGIFAQRASSRPNRLGLTTCEVLGVDGLEVRVRGLDAIDGTPVLDIKPYVREFAPRNEVRQPTWIGELMAGYW
jgi:tRNA-Thr(GGU) m(6)t(6)A37 methyltransferase TsaA